MASKIKLLSKGMDYLTLAINSPVVNTSRDITKTDDPRFKRYNSIQGGDVVFWKIRDHFSFKQEHLKPFRDPTDKFKPCEFYSSDTGVSLFRFSEKIPLSLKGQFFLSRNNPYKLKMELAYIARTTPISVSRIDFYKDYECESLEKMLFGLDHRKVRFDINKRNKKPVKGIYYYNTETGILESVSFHKATLSIKIYRKDIEKDQIVSEIKKKRVDQLYLNKQVVRIEISLHNSSKKCEAYFKQFLYGRKSISTICDDLFLEFSEKYPFKKGDRVLNKVKQIWRL